MPSEPTLHELRLKLLAVLKSKLNDKGFKEIAHLKDPVREELRLIHGEPAKDKYTDILNDLVWELMTQGIIAPFRGDANVLPFIHITAYGRQCLSDGPVLAYDASGFLKDIFGMVPQLDNVCKTYLTEAVEAFNKRLLLSSTVMLGTASEHLVLKLIDGYKNALQPVSKAGFERKVDGVWISTKFDKLDESFTVKADSGAIPEEYAQDFRNCVKPLFDLYRQNRNAAGHPTGVTVDENILRAHLQAFAAYARRLFKLVEFLESKAGQL